MHCTVESISSFLKHWWSTTGSEANAKDSARSPGHRTKNVCKILSSEPAFVTEASFQPKSSYARTSANKPGQPATVATPWLTHCEAKGQLMGARSGLEVGAPSGKRFGKLTS